MVSAMRKWRVQTVIVSFGGLGKIENEAIHALLSRSHAANTHTNPY
jgi:hypothetical protein